MRIARIEIDGAARAAIVAADASSASLLPPEVSVVDLLAADPAEREQIAARADGEVALSDARLLAPVQPPTVRDFSVFEQHIEGVRMNAQPRRPGARDLVRVAVLLLLEPARGSGPGAEIPVPPGCVDLDFELEVAAVIGRAGRNLRPDEAGAAHRGLHDLQRLVRARSAGRRDAARARDLQGQGLRQHPRPLDRHRRRARALPREGDRLDLDLRASSTVARSATTRWPTWRGASRSSSPTPRAARGFAPGDVLGSGTCGGGCLLELWGRYGRDELPPLAPGDTVTLTVEGIGTLTNTVVAGVDPIPLPRARPGRLRSRAAA